MEFLPCVLQDIVPHRVRCPKRNASCFPNSTRWPCHCHYEKPSTTTKVAHPRGFHEMNLVFELKLFNIELWVCCIWKWEGTHTQEKRQQAKLHCHFRLLTFFQYFDLFFLFFLNHGRGDNHTVPFLPRQACLLGPQMMTSIRRKLLRATEHPFPSPIVGKSWRFHHQPCQQ